MGSCSYQAGKTYRISTREAHGRGLLRASTANNVQLSTFHVELSTRVVASAMTVYNLLATEL